MTSFWTAPAAPSREKQHGVHYTPASLAVAVAARLSKAAGDGHQSTPLVLADPACGDGELLQALVEALRGDGVKAPLQVHALDRDSTAIHATIKRLSGLVDLHAHCVDFLAAACDQGSLFGERTPALPPVDVLIANPPYVRTQVLGSAGAQALAARFGLGGRVDLAYAFAMAMIETVIPGGHFAIILSNKFLTIQAGASLRRFLQAETEILELWDLGDSRLFAAAVLPVVLFGRRARGAFRSGVPFRSIYQLPADGVSPNVPDMQGNDEALARFAAANHTDTCSWKGANWQVRVGQLAVKPGSGAWLLRDSASDKVTIAIGGRRTILWRDVLRTSVGIKTTADNVFIRPLTEWRDMPQTQRPEADVLWPVRLTNDVARWALTHAHELEHRVLYPFVATSAKRTPVDLRDYPRAAEYLHQHREQLEGRQYVINGGRRWYEPWVPHQPARWSLPRLLCRDIAAEPAFAVDVSGAIPNGTLYWSAGREDSGAEELLWAACAVANSTWCGEYYDLVLGTRLYAGRRRYNTQALNEFLLPAADSAIRELSALAHEAAEAASAGRYEEVRCAENEIDIACRSFFG